MRGIACCLISEALSPAVSRLTVLLALGSLEMFESRLSICADVGGVGSAGGVSSERDSMNSINELFTWFAACLTLSMSLDMAGRTWESSRGTNGRISSGHISKKLSIQRRAVTWISSSAEQLNKGCQQENGE